jgi:hypothetical protein
VIAGDRARVQPLGDQEREQEPEQVGREQRALDQPAATAADAAPFRDESERALVDDLPDAGRKCVGQRAQVTASTRRASDRNIASTSGERSIATGSQPVALATWSVSSGQGM